MNHNVTKELFRQKLKTNKNDSRIFKLNLVELWFVKFFWVHRKRTGGGKGNTEYLGKILPKLLNSFLTWNPKCYEGIALSTLF